MAYEWLIFIGLLVAFAAVLWLWYHTEPAGPPDFSR